MQVSIQRRAVVGAGALAAASLYLLARDPHKAELPVPEVDITGAKALIDAGALVIDVRGKDPYDFRHVPGALWVPLSQLVAEIPASLAGAKDKSIVVYCNDGLATGPKGTRALLERGYAHAVNMKAGVEGWDAAGLPLVRGKSA